jgi:[ribosomal protein S18]-alanine N-acetyltransferase
MIRAQRTRAREDLPRGRDFTLADLEITPMRRRHLRGVLAIEEQVFSTPWSHALFLSELGQPATRGYQVARVGQDVVGYGGIMLVVGEAHINTIGVLPTYQHRGIGRLLLWHLAHDARDRGAFALTLEVRVSNEPAQALYREFGFAPAGVRKGYYIDPGKSTREDALIMWANDADGPDFARRLDRIESDLRARGR